MPGETDRQKDRQTILKNNKTTKSDDQSKQSKKSKRFRKDNQNHIKQQIAPRKGCGR
jgi:hypothetical protein